MGRGPAGSSYCTHSKQEEETMSLTPRPVLTVSQADAEPPVRNTSSGTVRDLSSGVWRLSRAAGEPTCPNPFTDGAHGISSLHRVSEPPAVSAAVVAAAPVGTAADRAPGRVPSGPASRKSGSRSRSRSGSGSDRRASVTELRTLTEPGVAGVPRTSPSWTDREAGMATAEYAIATLAAVAFAGLLAVVLGSDEVRSMLLSLIRSALTLG